MKTYDYTCNKCNHEFDFCEGEQHHFGQSWIECPMCKEILNENEIESHIPMNTYNINPLMGDIINAHSKPIK